MVMGLFFFAYCCCIALSGAEIKICHVRQEAGQTTYSISGRTAGTEGDYLWSNGSRHTLAYNKAKFTGLVLTNSIDDLITSKCIPVVNYELTSKKGLYYAANCTTTCTEIITSKEDKVISRHYIVTWVVFAAFIFVVGVLTAAMWKRNSNATMDMEEGDG